MYNELVSIMAIPVKGLLAGRKLVVTMLEEAPAPTPETGVALTADDGFRMGDIMLVTTFDGTFDL